VIRRGKKQNRKSFRPPGSSFCFALQFGLAEVSEKEWHLKPSR
jgi:hypothetical protein